MAAHDGTEGLDVQYNPEIIEGILKDLEKQVNNKCSQIQREADFIGTSIKQAFNLEMIKLPTQVKKMSLARFRTEYGDSLEAVTRGAIGGKGIKGSSKSSRDNHNSENKNNGNKDKDSWSGAGASANSKSVFQTPGGRARGVPKTPSTAARRMPKEGEQLLSKDGSPLGEFDTSTIVKSARGEGLVPATPGANIKVPLNSGEVVDLEDADIDNLSSDVKQDALAKMEAMMANMQNLMNKLKK